MALTVYLLQSGVMFAMAHSGYWGEVNRASVFGLAVLIWLGCIFFPNGGCGDIPLGPSNICGVVGLTAVVDNMPA